MKRQAGFTLIELIMVIVILGILAATALPKFVDLSSDAKSAALKGVAGALSSAGSVNYAGRAISSVYGTQVTTGADTCAAVATAILEGGVPSGYTVTGTPPNCLVTQADGGATASAVVPVTTQ